jgi:hypothetical protein
MRTIGFTFIFLQGLVFSVCGQDRIRELFEWGEYDSLLVAIPSYCSGNGRTIDSARLCDYFSYLGVAFFAKGNIADARGAFKQAILCRSSIALDSQYVTPEMLNLFSDCRQEIEQEKERRRKDDSLGAAAENQRKLRENERKAGEERHTRVAALTSSFRMNMSFTTALFTLCAAGVGAAIHEYRVGREYDTEFRSAANVGDLRKYNRYRDLLNRQNRDILSFSAVSAVSGCVGAWFGVRSIRVYSLRAAITLLDGSYGIRLATGL